MPFQPTSPPLEDDRGATLRIRLFGVLEAHVQGVPVAGLRLREGERLLAYLTLHHGEEIAYRSLAQLFWPSEARVNIGATGDFPNTRQAIRALRQALGSEAHRLASPAKGIVSLDLTGAEVDLIAFDSRSAQDDTRAWREAIAFYRAPLLDGWPERWAVEARARRKRSFDRMVKQVILELLEQGDTAGVEPYLRQAVASSPTDERLTRDWMTTLAALGRYPEMEEAYEALRFRCTEASQPLEAETEALAAALRTEMTTAVVRTPVTARQPVGVPTGPASSTGESAVERAAHQAALLRALEEDTETSAEPLRLESVGGAVALDSKFYVVRPTDTEFQSAVERSESIVLVKGARQMGKTSLLARGLQQARDRGARVVLTDLQTLNESQLDSADSLFQALAVAIKLQLDLDVSIKKIWDPDFGANMNLELFLRRQVLSAFPEPFVWGLDEVDRLFGHPFGSEVFGLFRSWHNLRSLEPTGPWSRFTLAISYATEAHLFITDINQSPFNVGTRVALQDFTREQVEELNRRHESPLQSAEQRERFYQLLSGHPYLVRLGLAEMTRNGYDIAVLEACADRDDGPFGDHLRRLLAALSRDPEMAAIVGMVLHGAPCPTPESFYRLRSAGLVAGEWGQDVGMRCRLYTNYLRRYLL